MDLVDQLRQIGSRASSQLPNLQTEEATKTALVLPFLQALGYDVFDPTEVTPEFTADVGTKKGEKVDYAVLRDGEPIILFECKTATANLDQDHASQLYRYFSVTEARFGILTNGIEYRVYSDLEEPNKMDSRPFLDFKITAADEALAKDLLRFSKESFDLEDILSNASDLKYRRELRRQFEKEFSGPSHEFVRLFAGRVYSGNLIQQVRDQFQGIVQRAFQEFVSEKVNSRLKLALDRDVGTPEPVGEPPEKPVTEPEVVTTEEEVEAFYTVKAILRGTVDVKRVSLRDHKSYCNILLDNSNRKPLVRLHFDRTPMQIGIFDSDKNETRHSVETVDSLLEHAEAIRATANGYLGNRTVAE
jgi:hypothetical protein